jgi:hypothetical protein
MLPLAQGAGSSDVPVSAAFVSCMVSKESRVNGNFVTKAPVSGAICAVQNKLGPLSKASCRKVKTARCGCIFSTLEAETGESEVQGHLQVHTAFELHKTLINITKSWLVV